MRITILREWGECERCTRDTIVANKMWKEEKTHTATHTHVLNRITRIYLFNFFCVRSGLCSCIFSYRLIKFQLSKEQKTWRQRACGYVGALRLIASCCPLCCPFPPHFLVIFVPFFFRHSVHSLNCRTEFPIYLCYSLLLPARKKNDGMHRHTLYRIQEISPDLYIRSGCEEFIISSIRFYVQLNRNTFKLVVYCFMTSLRIIFRQSDVKFTRECFRINARRLCHKYRIMKEHKNGPTYFFSFEKGMKRCDCLAQYVSSIFFPNHLTYAV